MQFSLRSMHVRHYKSLDDVRVDLPTPVTVIVGPNAVGKSNVVDCLRFVRDAVSTDLEHAVGKRGGIGRVRQYSRTKPYKVTISLTFNQTFEFHDPAIASYEFTLQSLTGGNYVVEHEKATCRLEAWPSSERDSDDPDPVLIDNGFERDKEGFVTAAGSTPLERPIRPDQLGGFLPIRNLHVRDDHPAPGPGCGHGNGPPDAAGRARDHHHPALQRPRRGRGR